MFVAYLDVSHVLTKGMYPKFLESTNTMPHRDTVAGDAYCRSPTCTDTRDPFLVTGLHSAFDCKTRTSAWLTLAFILHSLYMLNAGSIFQHCALLVQ